MKTTVIPLLFTAVLLSSPLAAKEYENILWYKNCGTWKSNASIIQSGVDSGRIAWDGKTLRFTPRGGGVELKKLLRFDFTPRESVFDLKNIYCFGFSIRVPENMRTQPFTVKFIYAEGKPVIWNRHTPAHTGWQGANARVLPGKGLRIRPEKLKAVEFSSEVPGFKAFLDDIRFVPKGLDFLFEEAWVSPVTNGCFFPEYTLEQQRKETLDDPDFKAKMAEIEQLRQTKMQIKLKPMHTDPKELLGNALIARIRPDGSVEGLSFEDVIRIHKERRYWHDINETFMLLHCHFYNKLLSSWEWGRVSRTEENRKKIFKSLIRTLTAESNRRNECIRYVIPAFVMPSTACMAYRMFFREMDAVEKGISRAPDSVRLNRLLKEAATWCYFHTFYQTLAPTLTVDSFRGDSFWTGGNFSYRPTFWAALVCRNPKMLEVISAVAKGALSITSYNTMKEAFWLDGMTADGSAWGHNNQNYPFGYPLYGVLGIGELIGNLSGSRWALKTDGPAFDAFCNYMEGLLWHGTTWANTAGALLQRDIPAACGRTGQLYRKGKGYADFGEVYSTLGKYIKLLPDDSIQKKRLRHCIDVITGKDRNLPVGTRYFWNNDLLLCREKESLTAISMLSSRVLSIESAPCDSHFTDFWSDGAAWVMKHFDSYRTARGFLKPCATPGVTARQWEFTHTGNYFRSYSGLYNFAGGAADGNYAVCGYRMGRKRNLFSPDPNFYDLEAKKSYFWVNGRLVCIGTGITDKTRRDVPVATTIDQTLWRGSAQDASGTVRNPGENFTAKSQLLWHDGVGYWILNGKGVLSGETRMDRWAEFDWRNGKAENLPKTAPILMFQIDHGKNPKNGSYAYMVDFHSPDFASLKKQVQLPPFEIVSATSDIHAVREKSSGTLAAVFYKPGEIGGLKVDVPAVVLLRRAQDGDRILTISDPEQNPKRDSVMLGWDGKHYEIKLPTGLYCGQPATVNLSKNKPVTKEYYKMKKAVMAVALAAAISGQAQNLVQNPDFRIADKKGHAAGWSYQDNKFSRVEADKPGCFVMKSAEIVRPADKISVTFTISQKIKIAKPGKYVLTFTGKVVKEGAINVSWVFFDQKMKQIRLNGVYWSQAHFGKESKKITHVLDIPEGVSMIRLYVNGIEDKRRNENSGSVIIEEVTMTPQKEN